MHAYNQKLMEQRRKRSIKAVALRNKGLTFAEIGRKMRVSRQRAEQLYYAETGR